MILQLRRWLPHRRIVVVADSSYAALDLLHFCQSMQRTRHLHYQTASRCRAL